MKKLIVEMEMPSSCFGCPMSINYNKIVICSLDNARREGDFDFRPDWCPITGELPEQHGDLVDYNEVKEEFDRLLGYMEETPSEISNVVWFRREYIIPRGYEMKFHVIVKAERKDDGTTVD